MIRYSGEHVVRWPREAVFRRLQEPDVLARSIPACESLVPLAPGTFRARIPVALGFFRGAMEGNVTVREARPPEAIDVEFDAAGTGSTIRGTMGFRLEPAGNGSTRVRFESEAEVRGLLYAAKGRIVQGARQFADRFFSALERSLESHPGDLPPAPLA